MDLAPGLALRHDCVTVCFDNLVLRLSFYRQAAIISLAHLTSWSAERIASATLRACPDEHGRVTGKEAATMYPETVWDLYMSWRRHIPFHKAQMEDIEQGMWRVIHEFGFDTTGTAEVGGLANTPRPTSFPYAKLWFPSERHQHTVLPSYVPEDDIDNYKTCVRLGERGELVTFTTAEREAINQFGPHVLPMMKKILTECIEFFELDMMRTEFNQKIFDLSRHLPDIVRLGNRAAELWCQKFGSIDSHVTSLNVKYYEAEGDCVMEKETGENEHSSGSQHAEPELSRSQNPIQIKNLIIEKKGKCVVHLNSSPEVIKMFVICMVTDRIHALDVLRLNRRRQIGLSYIAVKDLPNTSKDCPICHEPLGALNEDGKIEYPVRLLCCCGQYIGERCLKEWYRYFNGTSCPVCRGVPTKTFFEKLFEDELFDEEAPEDDDETSSWPSDDSAISIEEYDLEEGEIRVLPAVQRSTEDWEMLD